MNKKYTIAALLFICIAFTACNKNYYSGNNKGGKGCGCPAAKR